MTKLLQSKGMGEENRMGTQNRNKKQVGTGNNSIPIDPHRLVWNQEI